MDWLSYKKANKKHSILARPAFESGVSSTGVHLKLKNKSKGKVAIFLRSSASPSLQFHVAKFLMLASGVWPREEKCPQNRQTQRVEGFYEMGGGVFCVGFFESGPS